MRKTKCAAYVRVSTTEQSTKAQESELREYIANRGWSLVRIYSDRISGLKSTRPALNQLLSDARRRKFSCMVVWRIDRLGRSVPHLLEVLESFRALGIEFISLSEAIDTSTPTGMMVFTVLAAVASLERSCRKRICDYQGLAVQEKNPDFLGIWGYPARLRVPPGSPAPPSGVPVSCGCSH